MTNDGPGAAYFGTLSAAGVESSVLQRTHEASVVWTTHPRIPLNRSRGCKTGNCGWPTAGGFLIVLNGTGAGQVRRIVVEPAQGTKWILDEPLGPVEFGSGGSFVQIAPYRGRNIFQSNTFRDVGCFQIWGTGLDTIVDRNVYDRTAGLISWGQWRGWYGHEMQTTTSHAITLSATSGAIRGEGAQPSWFNQFSSNVFTEPGVVNYATSDTIGGYDFGRGFNLASTNGALDAQKLPTPSGMSMNSFNIFRRNRILANGGILVADDSSNTVIEANTIEYPGGYRTDDLGICVQNCTSNIVVRANQAPVHRGLCGEVESY
eukprot:COSAG02_NODE_48_length_45421_cov_103.222100_4_plen_318_part_00